jgi:predicted DNA-binding mobile mystery protein A
MKKSRIAAQSRAALDGRFDELRPVVRFSPPHRGWIKAVRQALGMSTAQLARRLGVKQPSVIDLEESEARGTIQLATLRRAAEALDCTLVYALVPNQPLDSMVREQARLVARRRISAVEQTMRLEDQAARKKDVEARLDALAEDVDPRSLWDEA